MNAIFPDADLIKSIRALSAACWLTLIIVLACAIEGNVILLSHWTKSREVENAMNARAAEIRAETKRETEAFYQATGQR